MTIADSITKHTDHPKAGQVTDPVCGMSVDPATARHRAEHAGREYLFCSARCRERFVAEPERFIGDKPAPPAAPEGALWTCPMHPEIVRDGPGSCPICGMALEPMTPTAGEESNPELADMTRRFRVGVVLSLPLLVMAMGEHFVHGWHSALTSQPAIWIQLALATPVVLWCGAPFFQRGWQSLVNRHLNMFTLIALGTGVEMESASVTLVGGDLRGIVRARHLSRATMRNIRQNLFSRSPSTRSRCRSRPACSIRSSGYC
ncbi:MAG TPA: heavy metal-binding domain-containing protein [Stellaceae bacterium]|nr:heavy metal-binding domain-containing protein [Stellaceae bacterium]